MLIKSYTWVTNFARLVNFMKNRVAIMHNVLSLVDQTSSLCAKSLLFYFMQN